MAYPTELKKSYSGIVQSSARCVKPFHLRQSDIGLNMKSSRCSMRLLRKLTWRTSTRNGDGLTDMYRKVVRI